MAKRFTIPRYSLGCLLAIVTMAAVCCGLYAQLTHVQAGQNVAHVDWLPASATNVSYYRSYNFTAYEFDISERDFLAWSRWDVRPISQPVDIFRYSYFDNMRGPRPDMANEAAWMKWKGRGEATIHDGWHYETKFGNSGGGVEVAYDRANGRAYFQSNPR